MVKVLECRKCGFAGTVERFGIADGFVFCVECGHPYLAYSEITLGQYYALYDSQEEAGRKQAKWVHVGDGIYDRKE